MIIMALDYSKRSGDTSLLTAYETQLEQWGQYLISNTLYPADQLSTTDFAGCALVTLTVLLVRS